AHPLFAGAVLYEEVDALDLGQMADDFREGPRDRRKLAGPVGEFMRPGEPGGFVRFPFGGHAEAEGVRFGGIRCLAHRGPLPGALTNVALAAHAVSTTNRAFIRRASG